MEEPSRSLSFLHRHRSALVWERWIKESKCVRRLDHASPFSLLLFCNLLMQLLHFRPMQFGTKVVLRMVPVVEPERIVDLFVGAYAPGNRFVRVPAVMQEVPVQVRKTMPNVVEGQEVQDEFPIQDPHQHKETEESGDFGHPPIRVAPALPFDFLKDRFGIVAHIAEKDVTPDVLCLAIVTVPVDRQPIHRLPFFIGSVAVPHVVPMMDILIKCLRESERDGFHDGKHPIQRTPTEIGVVNKVVRNPVDVPGNANGVEESQANQHPPWSNRKEREQGQNVSKVQHSAQDRQCIPFRIGQYLHTP
jgi:hypothetical protein